MKQKEIITDQDYYEEAIILREKRQGLIKAVVILSLVICVLVGIIVFESYLFQKQYSQSQLNMQTIQNLKEKYKNTECDCDDECDCDCDCDDECEEGECHCGHHH